MNNSHKIFLIGISFLVLTFSCKNPSDLAKQFSCENNSQHFKLESVDDFNKSFTVKLPKHWNTKLYYDSVQSEIFTADTLKSLSESYIMDFSMLNAPLNITEELSKKIHQKNMDNMMETLKESFHTFKGKEAYAHLGIGKSRGSDFYVFQYYIKASQESYMMIKTEFYGKENFDSRFCEALNLIDKIEINN